MNLHIFLTVTSAYVMNNFNAEYLLILVKENGTGAVGSHMNNE
jgi:hypothetical protein